MQGFSCLFFFFLIQFSFTGTIDGFSSRKIETHPIGTIRYSALRDWKYQVESRLSLIERFVSGLKKAEMLKTDHDIQDGVNLQENH